MKNYDSWKLASPFDDEPTEEELEEMELAASIRELEEEEEWKFRRYQEEE